MNLILIPIYLDLGYLATQYRKGAIKIHTDLMVYKKTMETLPKMIKTRINSGSVRDLNVLKLLHKNLTHLVRYHDQHGATAVMQPQSTKPDIEQSKQNAQFVNLRLGSHHVEYFLGTQYTARNLLVPCHRLHQPPSVWFLLPLLFW